MSDTIERPAGARPEGFGGVVLKDGPAYDEARTVFNSMVDKRPAMIAQCESAADVVAAVRYGVGQGWRSPYAAEVTGWQGPRSPRAVWSSTYAG